MGPEIKVGKYTLESLTTGMYNDPKIAYREYIQNAVDSLEDAIETKIIKQDEIKIEIIVDDELDEISIYDNGTGIKAEEVYQILTNIGNSNKRHSSNRGFRGIGRLGGLSYCRKLKFITSYMGENVKSIIEFDCCKLKEILMPGQYDNYDLSQVINEVTSHNQEYENNEKHYCIVVMEGIDTFSDLLNLENIKSYVKQIAPLAYEKRFIWESKIKEIFEKNNCELSEFEIHIGNTKDDLKPIFKPNKDKFKANPKQKINDELYDVEVFEIKNDGELLAIGWYGKCQLYGQIVDKEMIGLRVRKGNILIGDYRVLDNIFRETRFNGYVQGEVFVLSDKLIPNARRDNFEQNEAYHSFIKILSETVGEVISKDIRAASTGRNKPFEKKIAEVKKIMNQASMINNSGFNSKVEKEAITALVQKATNDISILKVADSSEKEVKDIILGELSQSLVEIEESDNFKIKNANNLGRKEMNVLKVVTDILSKNLTKEFVDQIIDDIILELNN